MSHIDDNYSANGRSKTTIIHIEPPKVFQTERELGTAIDVTGILTVLAITAFAGGTSFVGALIALKRNFSEQQVLTFTAFGEGILMAAAVFEMVIEAETELGIVITIFTFLGGAIILTLANVIAVKKRRWSRAWYRTGFNSRIPCYRSIHRGCWSCNGISDFNRNTECSGRNCIISRNDDRKDSIPQ
jgi:hypothetical protein